MRPNFARRIFLVAAAAIGYNRVTFRPPARLGDTMDSELTEQQLMIRDLCRQIGEEKILPVRAHYDETGEFPWPIVEEFRRADLFGVLIPEAYGGLGGSEMDLVVMVEEP